MQQDSNHEVAIFWDFPSCPPPADRPGYTVTSSLRHIAQAFGSIKLFKAYLAISEHSRSNGDRASEIRGELQVSGISLTDVPIGSLSSVAEQMITVDILVHALDRSPARTTILLITNNPMFGYAIATLRLRGYRVAVVTSTHDHPTLISQASVHFDWSSDVLKHRILVPTTPDFVPSPRRAPQASFQPNANETVGVQTNGRLAANLEGSDGSRASAPKSLSNGKGRAFQPEDVELANFLPNLKNPGPRTNTDTETPYEFMSPRFRESTPSLYGDPPFTIPSNFPGDITPQRPAHTSSSSTRAESGPSWPNFGKSESIRGPSVPSTPRLNNINNKPTGSTQSRYDHVVREVDDFLPRGPPFPTQPSHPQYGHGGLSAAANIFQPLPADVLIDQGLAPGHFRLSPRISSSSSTLPSTPSKATSHASAANLAMAFQPLVDILRSHRTKGIHSPLRSTIALELIQQDKDIYKKAGVEKFAQYSALAEKEGIIRLGGKNGGAWIQLHPSWY